MSRLEKIRKEKYNKKKSKTICRVIFLFLMIIITIGSVLLIDYRTNEILGKDSKFNLTECLMNIF